MTTAIKEEEVLDLTGVDGYERFQELSKDIQRCYGGKAPFRRLRLSCYGVFREPLWREDNPVIESFFENVWRTCPCLESIRIQDVGLHAHTSGRFPVRYLSKTLLQKNVKEFIIRDAALEGTQEEWRNLGEILKCLKNLTIFILETCECILQHPPDGGNDAAGIPREVLLAAQQVQHEAIRTSVNFNTLLRNIPGATTLKRLVFDPVDYVLAIDNTALERLLTQFTMVCSLQLNNVQPLSNDNMVCIFDILCQQQESSALHTINLNYCAFEESGVQAFIRFLRLETSMLKQMELILFTGNATAPQNAPASALRQEEHMISLLYAFQRNGFLESVEIHGVDLISAKTTKAYLDMAAHNITLKNSWSLPHRIQRY